MKFGACEAARGRSLCEPHELEVRDGAQDRGVYIPKSAKRGVADAGVHMEEGCSNSAEGAVLMNVQVNGY